MKSYLHGIFLPIVQVAGTKSGLFIGIIFGVQSSSDKQIIHPKFVFFSSGCLPSHIEWLLKIYLFIYLFQQYRLGIWSGGCLDRLRYFND